MDIKNATGRTSMKYVMQSQAVEKAIKLIKGDPKLGEWNKSTNKKV